MSHSKWKYGDYTKLNYLAKLVADNIEELYEYFNVKYYVNEKMIISNCFIHGGDNMTALNFYHNSEYKFHFACRTHGCENHFKNTAIGFIRGALSNVRHGWEKVGDKEVTFNETIEFLLEQFDLTWDSIDTSKDLNLDIPTEKKIERQSQQIQEAPVPKFERSYYRSKVQIPSDYYLKRGYSIEVLDDYDIGTCKSWGKPLYNRAVVPVYDDKGEFIIGFSGRSIFDKQCSKCKNWHDPDKKCHFFPKWRHSKGFRKDKSLYN